LVPWTVKDVCIESCSTWVFRCYTIHPRFIWYAIIWLEQEYVAWSLWITHCQCNLLYIEYLQIKSPWHTLWL